MKKYTILTALLASVIAFSAAAGGCSVFSPNTPPESSPESTTESSPESTTESSVSENSDISVTESADTPENTGAESDTDNESNSVSESTESDSENDQESDTENDEDTQESRNEISYVSMTESEAAQASNEGYEFDDEQIVEDYHTAVTFTDNEEFNDIFKNNAYDSAYNEELKNAVSIQDMRTVTSSYAEKWKAMVGTVYDALSAELDSEDNEKLSESQEQWTQGLGKTESSFMEEAKSGGTEGLLSADTAIMNYYKGRAAKLLEQIYTYNGSLDLSAYGL